MTQQTAVRTSLTATALVRLLQELVTPRTRAADSRAAFADGLVKWTGWADAIALSSALEHSPPSVPLASDAPDALEAAGAASGIDGDAQAAGSESLPAACERVRTQLAQSIARETAAAGRSAMESHMGYTPFRQRYSARQQAMDLAVAALRDNVRSAAALHSPELARLAAVDAVLAQVLSAQERRLLHTVPTLLEKRYVQLRDAHARPEAGAPGASPDSAAPAWVAQFRREMQAVLLAELDLRLQPVQGLLQALGHPPTLVVTD